MSDQPLDEDPRRWSASIARRWGLLTEDVHRRLGPGVPLEPVARATFEGRLGGDLTGAMVHRSPLAGRLAHVLGAEALTTREHVLGDADALDAGTPGGAALLGHELAHVVQRDMTEAGEAAAQDVERAVAADGQPAPGGAAGQVDPEALADRVYRRMMDQLRLEMDRGALLS
jgi:hypothetical protein